MSIRTCYQDPNWNDEVLKKCLYWDEPWFSCEVCCNYTICSQLRGMSPLNAQDDLDALFDEIFNIRHVENESAIEYEYLPF